MDNFESRQSTGILIEARGENVPGEGVSQFTTRRIERIHQTDCEEGTQHMVKLNELKSGSSSARSAANRRKTTDRRTATEENYKGVERRQKPERRQKIDPTTCERDYTDDEVEFMRAMDEYKRKSGRMFPTWSEVLEVVRSLGYQKHGLPPATSATTPMNAH